MLRPPHLQSGNAAARAAGNAALVCMTLYIHVQENGFTRYRLTQHLVNLRILAEEH